MEFIKTFGTPSPNQEWGLTSAIVLLMKRASVGIQKKASQVERFLDMFYMPIGLVRPNSEFVLCMVG